MRAAPRLLRPPFASLLMLVAVLALSACAAGTSGSPPSEAEAATARTALPPPDLVSPAADASGRPLVEQPPSNAPAAEAKTAGVVDDACRSDADCAVKDIGNCCGYYPACVNVDSPTFPEQVKADCAKNDMMSVCGFRELSGCQCVDGRCQGIEGAEGPVR